jgi:hypothetical protein
MSPVKYELGFYIPEDDILHSRHRENLKSYIAIPLLCACAMLWECIYQATAYNRSCLVALALSLSGLK